MIEVIFHGSGGQGVVVAAKILADAAAKSGHQAQAFASYGGERRGGKVESFLRISETPIYVHAKVYQPDLAVLLGEQFTRDSNTTAGVKPGGTLLINTSKSPESFAGQKARVETIDADRIATASGVVLPSGLPVINTSIMGAVAALIPLIGIKELAEAIREGGIPYPEKNVKAARSAYQQVKSRLSGAAGTVAEEAPQASTEKAPAYKTKTAPCEANCPAGEPIRNTTRMVGEGRFAEALEAIRRENPFPGVCGRVCFHPCESHCNRKDYDQALATNALERAAFDYSQDVAKPVPKEKTGKRVAIIGSGPAGMTAAYFLALLGHEVTVLESLPAPGGVLRAGIPEYRLPKDIVEKEIREIAALGVKVQTGAEVGKDVPFENLLKYDAILVATGAHHSLPLNIPGEDARGVVGGLDFLKGVAFGQKPELGARVAVIGGGNVAIDAARTARRLGAEVTIVYRRSAEEMPAYREEVEAVEKEGVRINYLTQPVQVLTEKGRIKGLECVRTRLGPPDKSGRPQPETVPGSNLSLEVNTVITATGETVSVPFLPDSIERDGGLVKVDELGRTSMAKVYAGGDATTASRSVVEAIASGKRAALGMDLFLRGQEPARLPRRNGTVFMKSYLAGESISPDGVVSFSDLNLHYFEKSTRAAVSTKSSLRLKGNFNEVSRGLAQVAASAEARRCFQCGRCNLCENCYIFCPDVAVSYDEKVDAFTINRNVCKRCGICIKECPRSVLSWEAEL